MAALQDDKEVMISICVPAYKRVGFLKRLLDSIGLQSFRDFEVIVSDDSPDSSVRDLCLAYVSAFPLHYSNNQPALGTPENWNAALRKARGRWIKIMHDDDWFAFSDSLEKLYALTGSPAGCSFVFCGSTVIEEEKILFRDSISRFREKLLRKDPQNLFFRNFIGPPSVIMHRRDEGMMYDRRMKWLVDVDFYIQFLRIGRPFNFTREYLVNVGFNEGQVTRQVFHDRQVVIPENLLLIHKLEPRVLFRIWNYDFCWRLIRNYHIRDESELEKLRPPIADLKIPPPLLHIVGAQKKIPASLLRIGLFSKAFMLLNYFTSLVSRLNYQIFN